MGVSLSKGGNVSLTKEAPGLTAALVGLGWDARSTSGADFDLDASALLTGENGKVLSDQHFVFFNNLKSPDGSVEHTGDNLTGEGEGDDEVIKVNLAGVPGEVDKIVVAVSIYDAESRGQSFGQVRNAFIRVVNQDVIDPVLERRAFAEVDRIPQDRRARRLRRALVDVHVLGTASVVDNDDMVRAGAPQLVNQLAENFGRPVGGNQHNDGSGARHQRSLAEFVGK